MAVKVKVKRPEPPTPPTPRFTPDRYRHPQEQSARRQGLAVTAIAGVLALLFIMATPLRWPVGGAYLVWLAFCFLVYPRSAVGKERKAVLARAAAGEAHDDLAALLAKQARAVGTNPPPLVLDPQARGAYLLAGMIVLPAGARAYLGDAEVWATLARQLGHLLAGHDRLLALQRAAWNERSPLLRPITWPLRFAAGQMGQWRQYALMSADRLAMLLTRDLKVVGAAILKQEVELSGTDEVKPADIAEYLSQPGGLQAEGTAVSAHYRIGEFLRSRPALQDRFRELTAYGGTTEYREIVKLIDEGIKKA